MTNGSAQRLVYLHSHPRFYGHEIAPPQKKAERLAITITSQTGTGTASIAEELARHLQLKKSPGEPPWEVFARSLIERVLVDHHLPTRLARFLPEDTNSAVDEALDELFGLHPSSWIIAQKSADTILKLARAGNVILIGWGAHVITNQLSNAFHVRLVGSLEKRIQRIQERELLGRKQALAFIARQDRGRERYLRKYFSQHLSEPLLYRLTINTDRFSDEETMRLIADTALGRIKS